MLAIVFQGTQKSSKFKETADRNAAIAQTWDCFVPRGGDNNLDLSPRT
jgi:hypothetical protein